MAATAEAGTPPLGPGNVEAFPARDMVAIDGYVDQAGQTATVTATREGQVIGRGTGTVDANGFLEFNHAGAACWGPLDPNDPSTAVTPDLKGGDRIDVSFSGATFSDGMVIASSVITGYTTAGPDLSGAYSVTIEGTYGADVDLDRFMVEVVNPDMREEPGGIEDRAISWDPTLADGETNGGTGYTAMGTAADGAFSATFGGLSEADQHHVAAGEHVVLSWMADHPTVEQQLGLTLWESGQVNGPGDPSCPSGAADGMPVPPTTAEVTGLSTGATGFTVTWPVPQQPVDAPAVSQYRVSAYDAATGQEAAIRTAGTTATFQGLDGTKSYELLIEAFSGTVVPFDGRWSEAAPLGSVDLAAGTYTPRTSPGAGDGGTGGETPPPTSVEPTGVTATATGTTSVDVSWTAALDAVSYDVSLTPPTGDPISQTGVTATTASFTDLAPGTAYGVSVTAVDSAGTRTTSTESVSVTTLSDAPSTTTVTRVVGGHERVTLEWLAATPGNPATPVTGYELAATPVNADGTLGTPVTATVGTVTTGTIPGLSNGTTYRLDVVALAGESRGPAATFADGHPGTVVPNDVLTVGRAQFRDDRNEYRISGTAQDTTANTVTVRLSTGELVAQNVAVTADGAWSVSTRNGPQATAAATLTVTSSSGGSLTGVPMERR
ncbi:fibronectin type III domain-containing protein [Blastococcus sp. SYSU DS0533]